MSNALNWFEIPATDFERAVTFYETIFGTSLNKSENMSYMMGIFPNEGVSGAVIKGEGCEPSDKGTIVYLNGGEDLSTVLNKVESAGGSIVRPKTLINEEIGYFAIFHDTEGNKVALHSQG